MCVACGSGWPAEPSRLRSRLAAAISHTASGVSPPCAECGHHESGPGLALVALHRDRHQVPARHPVQLVVSDAPCQASSSTRRSGVSLSRISRAWRAHSLANPEARVSGTQICTGRSPAARSLSRRRCTRRVPVPLAVMRYMKRFTDPIATPTPVSKTTKTPKLPRPPKSPKSPKYPAHRRPVPKTPKTPKTPHPTAATAAAAHTARVRPPSMRRLWPVM